MSSRLKKRTIWNLVVSGLIGGFGFAGYSAGYGQPWEGMFVGLWWMYLVASMIVVSIIDYKVIFSFFSVLMSSISLGQKKKEEDMLRVNQLYKERIITKEEYDTRMSKLKSNSGF